VSAYTGAYSGYLPQIRSWFELLGPEPEKIADAMRAHAQNLYSWSALPTGTMIRYILRKEGLMPPPERRHPYRRAHLARPIEFDDPRGVWIGDDFSR
jgi:hypothetical protein